VPHEHVCAITHLQARRDKTEELKSALIGLLEPTRREPGCIRLEVQQNRATPTEFPIVAEWTDEQALQRHFGTSHSHRTMNDLFELLAVPLNLRFYFMVG
jgi:quinol monooxygenase YgiN